MNPYFLPVPLEKAYRLLNHGPTVLISASHQGQHNAMAAAWVGALDFNPPKITAVIDKSTATRALVDASGEFVVQVPNAAQADLVWKLGTTSQLKNPNKLADAGVKLFNVPETNTCLIEGCSAWLACRVLPNTQTQVPYDLFLVEVTAAWADERIFSQGHWLFETADPTWRSLHHVAGGQFYAIGEPVAAAGDAV